MHHAVDTLVHGTEIGTITKWRNVGSGDSGKIELARNLLEMANGERLATTLRARWSSMPAHYTLRGGLQPDGSWRLI